MESVKDTPESVADAVAMKAAHLIYCLIRNHPFLDGNKRTAFHVARVFCELNDYQIREVDPSEAVSILSNVADGKGDEGRLFAWIKKYLRKIE
jgi:death-on-curing protein